MSVFIDNNAGGVSIFPDAPGGSVIGPFKVGANLYVIAQGDLSLSADVAAYKSTDNGVTWTGPLNPATAWTISSFQGWFSACFDGVSKIYMVFYNQNVSPQLTLVYFDTTTDRWSAALFVARNLATLPNNNNAVSGYKELVTRPGGFVIRSDGTFVCSNIQMENVSAAFWDRTNVNVYSAAGAVVVENVKCGQNGAAVNDVHAATILGANDRTHIFYVEYSTKTLQHRTFTSANVVQAAQQVASPIFDPGGVNTQSLVESIGAPAFNAATGEIAIPYKDVNGNLRIARAISADTPVWTTEQVDNTIVLLQHGQSNGSQVSAAYYDANGNLEVVFLENEIAPAIVHIYQTAKLNGVWSVPVQQISTGIPSGGGSIIQSIHAVELGGNANMVFYTPDGSGLNYILSFAKLPDLAPPAGPNPRISGVQIYPLPHACVEREMCYPMASNKVFAFH